MYAEGRVEHQKRTQTATTLWPFGFVFGVQLGSLEKKKTRRGPVRAALVHLRERSRFSEGVSGVARRTGSCRKFRVLNQSIVIIKKVRTFSFSKYRLVNDTSIWWYIISLDILL